MAQAAAAYTTGIWNSEQSIERGRIEMTGVLRKLGLLVLTTLICTASADAELPGAKVSGLIAYHVVGPEDHPYLVLYLSTQYFDTGASSNTLLAVLRVRTVHKLGQRHKITLFTERGTVCTALRKRSLGSATGLAQSI